jgi:predicted lipoprotein with Yx(FWY)xxD motif
MKRLMTLSMAIPAAVALAACGGGGNSGAASSAPPPVTSSKTVAVRQLPGVGSVLVDHAGKALYSSDLEASGKIVCDATCNAFWQPLTLRGGRPTASVDAGKLGVIKRPDGSIQVTVNGKPLYTFAEDSPGSATGNGFRDQFGGHHFTWNVVRPVRTTTSPAGSPSGASTPNTTSGDGGGYTY